MKPTLRQMEYIVTVAETGRFGMAASKLNVSQPSLSAQIADTETFLGVRIFNRGRTGATITKEGEDIVRRARLILRDVEDLCVSVRDKGILAGRLRLGVLSSVGPYLLPPVVRDIHKNHPTLRLVVREENTQELEEGLKSGRLDMVISSPEDHPGTLQIPLFQERLWAAFAEDDPLAQDIDPIPLRKLSGHTLLTLGRAYRLSNVVSSLAAKCGGYVSDEYEGTSLDAIRLMAATGAGVAILPQLYAQTEAQRGRDIVLREIVDTSASRQIALIIPSSETVDSGAQVLADTLKKHAVDIMNDTP